MITVTDDLGPGFWISWTSIRTFDLICIKFRCRILSVILSFINGSQISAKRGPASRFVVEANTEALVSKSNSRQSEYVMVRGWNLEANIEAHIK